MKNPGIPSGKSSDDRTATRPISKRTALDWARDAGEAERLIAELNDFLRRRRRRRVSWAAAGLAMIGLVVILPPGRRTGINPSPISASIAANAVVVRPETRTLTDGTVVELNAGTEIEVDFTGERRRVSLHKGEAHFQVVKDAQRPFVVAANDVEVRAVGTSFSVELGAETIEVLVTEGRVAVEQAPKKSHPQFSAALRPDALGETFGAGKRIVVEFGGAGNSASAPRVSAVSRNEIDEQLAWRVPRLELSGTPLAQVLPMFNQYGRVRLTIADPVLGQLQLSGVLRADDTESLMRLLEGEFGLKADPRDGEIVLRRR